MLNLCYYKCFTLKQHVYFPSPNFSGQHFLDKHRIQLTQRVTNIDPILDELLDQNVIQQESYEKIRSMPTSQGKMRELYCSALKAGQTCKDIFYQILKKNEPYLIKDLEKM